MSHEVLITRRQSIFTFFANLGSWGPQKAGAGWCRLVLDAEASSSLDLQKKSKCFVFWLSGPHGTSHFDHQTLIRSDLNYTIAEYLGIIEKHHIQYQVNYLRINWRVKYAIFVVFFLKRC